MRVIGWIATLVFGMFVLAAVTGESERPGPSHGFTNDAPKASKADQDLTIAVLALKGMRAAMHDPKSFQVQQVLQMDDNALCITYRGRNGFGALRVGHAVINTHTTAFSGETKFRMLWRRHCNGKTGADLTHAKYLL